MTPPPNKHVTPMITYVGSLLLLPLLLQDPITHNRNHFIIW